MKIKNLLFIIFAISLMACGGSKKDKIDINALLEESASENNLEISAESMNAIIGSIPSPLEIAMVIKQSGMEFDETFLNPQANSKLYTTDQEKAFSIGVYGGDLGYINIYEKSYLTVNYLNTIKKTADAINIGQFFDLATIKRMASNNDKMDSLIYLSTLNFNKMDDFLRSQKRSKLSILLVTGTWTEGLFIATEVGKKNNNKDVVEWIGYQKMIVDQLLLGLSAYKSDEYFSKLINDMNILKDDYNKVSIVYEYHEPESMEVDGRLVIVDKSTSTVNMSTELFTQICGHVEQMRNRLINNK